MKRRQLLQSTLRPLAPALLGAVLALAGAVESRAAERAGALIVKLRSEGPAAVEACASALAQAGRSFASATRDGSASLDELFRRHRLGHPRVMFSTPDSRGGIASRREALARRFRRIAGDRASTGRRARTASSAEALPDLAAVYRIPLEDPAELEAARAALAADPHVEWVQADHPIQLDQASGGVDSPFFDDPFLASSGSWGEPYADLWGPAAIRAPEVWPFAQGEGAVVAVVDSGVDQQHPDLAANLWVNPGEDLDGNGRVDAADRNGLDDDGNGFIDDLTGFDFANSIDANGDGDFDDPGDVSDADPQDDNGHGTHVAGTAVAVADNGLGIVGIAPRARVMALKGFPASGSASDSVLWRAVLYAAENGATVVNNSWSCSTPCPSNPLAEEVLELVEALGLVVVTSAGNRATDVVFLSPERGDRVISVGAIGVDETLASFTNRGWLMDLVAPGGGPESPFAIPVARRNILSLRAAGTFEGEARFIVGEDYIRLAGTSMAAPHVAGAVAIVRALRPELGPREVRRLLRLTARDLGAPAHDAEFGAGLLDLAAASTLALPDATVALASPAIGAVHDPAAGPVALRGIAAGDDVVDFAVEIAPGTAGRDFEPLASFGDSRVDPDPTGDGRGFVGEWDVAAVEDGPHVIRLRARLRDDRVIDEFTLVAIERNEALRLSEGEREAQDPLVAGRALIWQADETEDDASTHDLVLGEFPAPVSRNASAPPLTTRVLPREGDQQSPVRDGAWIAWLEPTGPASRTVFHCRVDRMGRCEASVASGAPGSYGPLFLAGGWLVWARTQDGLRSLEGCRLDDRRRGQASCRPVPLVDPRDGGDWILHAFDGESLLLGRPGRLARCKLDPRTRACVPHDVALPPGESPVEPRHEGDLLAYSRLAIDQIRPPGCGASDPRPACAPQVVVVVEYLACRIDPVDSSCDPIVLSGRQPVENAAGIAVSGRRIAWAMGTETEQPALRYCELDPVARACPVQRVGGRFAAQLDPSLDAHRLVWSDLRAGLSEIRGIALPDLSGPTRRRVRAGRFFAIPLLADPGAQESLRFEVSALDGLDPVDARVRILGQGVRRGASHGSGPAAKPAPVLLFGRIPDGVSGTARWRIRGVGEGGLFSDHAIELAIEPPPPRPSPRHARREASAIVIGGR